VVIAMPKFTDEERARIAAEAYANLERPVPSGLESQSAPQDDRPCVHEILRTLPPTEDPLARWRREAEERQVRRERVQARRLTDAEAATLNRDMREHVAREIAATRQYMRDLVDTAIGEIAAVTGELAKEHDEAIKRLDGEVANLRAEVKAAGEVRRGAFETLVEPIDVPALPLRRVR